MKHSMKQFLLIDKNNPPSGVILAESYEDFIQKDDIYIYIGSGLIIFNCYNGYPVDQLEFPLPAIHWLVDSIENKFWKPPSEGGLDGVFHVLETINDELLRIGRVAHAGAENVPGFKFSNHSRREYIGKNIAHPQSHIVADLIMKEGGLFKRLKKLSDRVKAGEFHQ